MLFRKKSSERLSSKTEQASANNGAEIQYPKFDPEAAKHRIAEYKAAHPNAIEDVDKAYAMATAEDPYRTIAANARAAAKSAFEKAVDSDKRANITNLEKPRAFTDLTLEYAEENLRRGAKEYEKEAISFEEKARKNDAIAEQRGKLAGIKYDTERLSPEAEEEAKQKRIAEYKAAHPNAIEDVDKAYAMATAEDIYRTTAKEFRQRGKRQFEIKREAFGNEAADGAEWGLRDFIQDEEKANKYDAIAEQRGKLAGIKYDTERLSPEAKEEAKQKRIAEYKAAHPDAIEDIEKARFMAEAGDKFESITADAKKQAQEYFKQSNDANSLENMQYWRNKAYKSLEDAKAARKIAHETEDEAGEFYDQMKEI